MTYLPDTVARLTSEAPVSAVAVSVFDRGRVRARAVTGTADTTTGRAVTPGEWWDLASLTKTLVTLPEVLALVAEGRLALEQPLGEVWPRAAGRPIGAASAADLLSHRAGLPATVRFFETLSGADAIVGAALRAPIADPGRAVYSDLGFILLGAMVQDLRGYGLAVLAASRSGLVMGSAPGPAAATEQCPWRGRLITGEVHDENAWVMGGVAGHAGAFGTLDLVTATAQAWLAERVVTAQLHARARTCWSTNADGERFGLGWWLTPTRGIGGRSPGADGYGATGFVGNRIWLEPARGYGVVILSNRIHPVRGDRAPFAAWCDRLLDAVHQENQ
jgi:CubicO group peptidase (beta-lactamase class C family)